MIEHNNNMNMYLSSPDLILPHKSQRRPKQLVPSTEKNERYWERRNKNNEAARKSRENKRRMDFSMRQRISYLEDLNIQLEKHNSVLKTENELIKMKFKLPMDEVFLSINETGQLIGEQREAVLPDILQTLSDRISNASQDPEGQLDSQTQDSFPDGSRSQMHNSQKSPEAEQREDGSPSSDSHSEESTSGQGALVIDEGHIPVKKRRNKLICDSSSADLSIKCSTVASTDNGYSTDISSSDSSAGDAAMQPLKHKKCNSHETNLQRAEACHRMAQRKVPFYFPEQQVMSQPATMQSQYNYPHYHQTEHHIYSGHVSRPQVLGTSEQQIIIQPTHRPADNRVTPMQVPNPAAFFRLLSQEQAPLPNNPAPQQGLPTNLPMEAVIGEPEIGQEATPESVKQEQSDGNLRDRLTFLEKELQNMKQFIMHTSDQH